MNNRQFAIAEGCLSNLNKARIKALLAGGAVRDFILGKKAKDLDFFIEDDHHLVCPEEIRKALKIRKSHWEKLGAEVEGYDNPSIVSVYRGWVEGQLVNVILTADSAENFVSNFPISLSRAAIDHKGQLLTTALFEVSVNKKQFVYGPEVKKLYKHRMMDKYEDFLKVQLLDPLGQEFLFTRKIVSKKLFNERKY